MRQHTTPPPGLTQAEEDSIGGYPLTVEGVRRPTRKLDTKLMVALKEDARPAHVGNGPGLIVLRNRRISRVAEKLIALSI